MKLDEIAQLAGVSRTTASYVINGKAEQYRISTKTRDRVMAVVEQHGFHPDHGASSLRRGSSRTIGLVIPDLGNSSYAHLAKLLESKVRAAGFQLIITCTDDNPATEKDVVNGLLSRKLDALIVASCLYDDGDQGYYRHILSGGTPVIAIDRVMSPELFASIASEDEEGALQLTEHLLSSHPSSIVLLGARPELNVSQRRERGFKKRWPATRVKHRAEPNMSTRLWQRAVAS